MRATRLTRYLVCAAMAMAACGGGDGGPDANLVYPPLADWSRDVVDTSLTVDVGAHTGTATITLAPSESAGASFEIGDLDVTAVRAGAADLLWRDNGDSLDLGVAPSQAPVTVTIDYGYRLHNAGDGVATNGYTLTWPYFCGNVFPCKSDPSDGTTFHMAVTGNASGTIVFPTEIPTEAPSYMAAWIVGDYTRLDLGQTTAGTSVSMWYLPNEAGAAAAGGAHLREVFDWYEQNLGPYRFGTQVGSVSARWGNGAYGGMEHHPYWHVASGTALANQEVNAHEAAHGWFGNGIRIRCWEDFVLSEGTVTYLAWRALLETAGATVADPVWARYTNQVDAMRNGTGNGVAWPQSCGTVDILDDGLFSNVPYMKGAFFYRAVELKVGTAAFDQALRTFYQRWAGKAAGMQDMLDVIDEVTGYDPTTCAQQWLIDTTVPAAGPCP